jgi:hypothetical protein
MRQLFFLSSFFISLCSFGQTTFSGQFLSIVDGTPIANLYFRVNKKKLEKTDSLGFFSFTISKNKAHISVSRIYGIDTIFRRKNNDNLKLYTVKNYDSTLADFDIRQNKFRLFCGVAFKSVFAEGDKDFEKKYNVRYHIVGDFLRSSVAQMTSYNMVVADYLDKKYGKGWRLEIRRDVLGLMQKKTVNQQRVPVRM